MAEKKKLDPKHERFIDEYMFDLDGTQSAIRAGYSPASATSRASKLLARADVKDELARRMAERSKRVGVSQDRVLAELAKIAFANPADFMNLNTGEVKQNFSRDDVAAITGVKYKRTDGDTVSSVERSIDFANKVKALETIGKHIGMFQNNIELDTKLEIKISGDFDDC